MNEVKYLQSLSIESLLSPDISENSESFLLFLKAYYEWLETTKLDIINASGNFIRDEQIIGSTSGAYGFIKQIDDGQLIILVKSRIPFLINETIVGQASGVTATVVGIKDNIVRASGSIVDYRTLEKSVDRYVDYLRDELFESIPKEAFLSSTYLATKLKDFFSSRSTEQSYRFLFRLLYNEEVEFYYPGDDILRVSDGKFNKPEIFRAVNTPRIFEFLGRTVRGATEIDLANIIDIRVFFFGGIEIAEMSLKFVSGSFAGGDTITALEDPTLSTTLYGLISSIQIVSGGSGYSVGNPVTITGDGAEARAIVSSVSTSSASSLIVSGITGFELGVGYRVGTEAFVDNSGTFGSGLVIRVTEIQNPYTVVDTVNAITYTVGDIKTVSIINPGEGYQFAPVVTLEDTDIKNLGLLSERLITIDNGGNLYEVGDQLVFTGGSGTGANGFVSSVDEIFANRFISELSANAISEFETTRLDEPYERNNVFLEDGFSIILEGSFFDELKLEEWSGVGPIRRIELNDFGSGYTNEDLPLVSVTSANGSLAQLTVRAVQGTGVSVNVQVGASSGIGTIRAIDIIDYGVNYTTANADISAFGDGNAILVPVISGIGTETGDWINDDGKLDYKILQDSFFYQDFSYVIRSGVPFSVYADTLKNIIHPAGLQPFGEIIIKKFTDASADFTASISHVVVQIRSLLNIGVVDIIAQIDNKYRVEILPANLDLTASVDEDLLVYEPIQGTVSYVGGTSLGDSLISVYENAQIQGFASFTFTEDIPFVVGNLTFFEIDFAVDDIMIANNEYFIVKTVTSNTSLTIDRPPENVFTNVVAYKQIA